MGLNEKIPSLDPNHFGPNRLDQVNTKRKRPIHGALRSIRALTLRRAFDSFTNKPV